jgi:hypothetical protein
LPLIARVIAKVLVLADAFACYFVTTEEMYLPSYTTCANFVVLNAEITDCGRSVVTWLSSMTSVTLWVIDFIVVHFVAGLVAV